MKENETGTKNEAEIILQVTTYSIYQQQLGRMPVPYHGEHFKVHQER